MVQLTDISADVKVVDVFEQSGVDVVFRHRVLETTTVANLKFRSRSSCDFEVVFEENEEIVRDSYNTSGVLELQLRQLEIVVHGVGHTIGKGGDCRSLISDDYIRSGLAHVHGCHSLVCWEPQSCECDLVVS